MVPSLLASEQGEENKARITVPNIAGVLSESSGPKE